MLPALKHVLKPRGNLRTSNDNFLMSSVITRANCRHKSLVAPSSNGARRRQKLEDNTEKTFRDQNNINFLDNLEADWEEFQIPVPWGVLAGKAVGNKGAPPILGLHGWLDNAGSYDTLAPLLDLNSMYFLTFDLPGHGFSTHLPPGMSYNYVEYLLTIRRVIRHLKWDKFSIIGHSMGGGLGALYSGIYPQEVERLVLLDLVKLVTNPLDESYPKYFNYIFESYLDLEEKSAAQVHPPTYTWEEALKRLVVGTKYALTEESAKILMKRGTKEVGSSGQWEFRRDIRVNKFGILRFSQPDVFEIHKQIKCPILLLKAKDGMKYETDAVMEAGIRIYRENCPDFRLIETVGGHFFHLNKPLETSGYINEFFRSTPK